MESLFVFFTFFSTHNRQQAMTETWQISWVAIATVAFLLYYQTQFQSIMYQKSAPSFHFFIIDWFSTCSKKWLLAIKTFFLASFWRGLLLLQIRVIWRVLCHYTNKWLVDAGTCANNATAFFRRSIRKDLGLPRTTDGSPDSPDDGAKCTAPRSNRPWTHRTLMPYWGKFKPIIPYLIPREDQLVRRCIYICIACIFVQRVMMIIIPEAFGEVVDKLIAGNTSYNGLVKVGFYLTISESVLPMISGLASLKVEQYCQHKLFNGVFPRLVPINNKAHAQQDSTEAGRAASHVEATTDMLRVTFLEILPQVADWCILFPFLYVKFQMSIPIYMTVIFIVYVAADLITSNRNIENYDSVLKHMHSVQRLICRTVEGWRNVFAFNKLEYEQDRLAEAHKSQQTAYKKWSVRNMWASFGMLSLFLSTTFCLLSLLIIHEIRAGRASLGDLLSFWQYWERLTFPLRYTSYNYRQILQYLPSLKSLLNIIATELLNRDKGEAPTLRSGTGGIEFSDVNTSVLRNISISVAPGQLFVIVGTTGAGKTSLLELLMGYDDPTTGSIKIDDQDIQCVDRRSLWDTVGIVRQNPEPMEGTITENLEYANSSASHDDIKHASNVASIHNDILSFPEGYNTIVGEPGRKLSGGELKRLTLARALLRDWPILCVDEVTSDVDNKTGTDILNALVRERHGKTTVVVTHRLNGIATAADLVVVMHKGAIVEKGTHEQLLGRNQMYTRLWNQETGLPSTESAPRDTFAELHH